MPVPPLIIIGTLWAGVIALLLMPVSRGVLVKLVSYSLSLSPGPHQFFLHHIQSEWCGLPGKELNLWGTGLPLHTSPCKKSQGITLCGRHYAQILPKVGSMHTTSFRWTFTYSMLVSANDSLRPGFKLTQRMIWPAMCIVTSSFTRFSSLGPTLKH